MEHGVKVSFVKLRTEKEIAMDTRKKCREPHENATNFDNEIPISLFLATDDKTNHFRVAIKHYGKEKTRASWKGSRTVSNR